MEVVVYFLAISVQRDTRIIELPSRQQTLISFAGEGALLP